MQGRGYRFYNESALVQIPTEFIAQKTQIVRSSQLLI